MQTPACDSHGEGGGGRGKILEEVWRLSRCSLQPALCGRVLVQLESEPRHNLSWQAVCELIAINKLVAINIILGVSGLTGSLQKLTSLGTGSLQNPLDRMRIAGGSHQDRTNPGGGEGSGTNPQRGLPDRPQLARGATRTRFFGCRWSFDRLGRSRWPSGGLPDQFLIYVC